MSYQVHIPSLRTRAKKSREGGKRRAQKRTRESSTSSAASKVPDRPTHGFYALLLLSILVLQTHLLTHFKLKVPGSAIVSNSIDFSVLSSRFHLVEFELFGALMEARSPVHLLPSMHFLEQTREK